MLPFANWASSLGCALFIAVKLLLPTRADAQQLRLHHAVERPLSPGQVNDYTLDVTPGRFVRVVVLQMGVDLAVSVSAQSRNNSAHGA